MEKITLYKIAIAGLVVLNLVLVFFLWAGRPRSGQAHFRALESFGLTQDQRESFQKSVKAHQAILQQIETAQKPILKEYFESLKVTPTASALPVPTTVLELEEQKIQATYQHFLAVKDILNPDQLGEYPAFIDFVIRQVVERKEKRPPPVKD